MADSGTTPTFRRPTREDALTLARAHFLAGERVEMQSLSAQLDISRTTLYRWVGEREELMGEVFSGLINEWVAEVAPESKGEGFDLFLDMLSRFLRRAAQTDPLTEFTQREPTLALRVLTDPKGPVTRRTNEVIGALLTELEPTVEVPRAIADAIGLVSRTLVWVNIAAGQEPEIDEAMEIASTLLGNLTEASKRRAK